MKRVLVISATLALGLTGCSAGSSTSGGASAGAARDSASVGFAAEPANLDFSATDGAAIPQVLLVNVYEGLVRLDADGKIQPQLAKAWTVSDDRKTYDFQLQSGAKFSNGDAFDAAAVKFSIERVKSAAWKISLKKYMDVVDRVEIVSPTEVKVTLTRPSNDWLFRMTTRIGAMFSPTGVADLANAPVGTGPYTMQKWTRGDSITLARRDDYWGRKPALKTVTFKYFKDANAANNALLTGGIDAIVGLQSPDSVPQFKADSKLQVIVGSSNGELVLSLNNATGPFKDKRVRQAVNHAIDRKALLQAAAAGYGTLIGSMVPPTDPWYEDLANAYPYDPEKAKALLAEAGVGGLTVRFRVPNLPYAVAAAQLVKSDLAKAGVTANIDVLEFPARWLDVVFQKHDYDMSIISHVEARDIATFADPKYYWGYDNRGVQQLTQEADAGTEQDQVTKLKQVARTLSDDAVCDWLYLGANLDVAKKGLGGIPQNLIGEAFDVTALTWS